MTKILIGVIIGIVIATVGFSGIAQLLDNGVRSIQQTSKELAR